MNTNSYSSLKTILKTSLRKEKIPQVYHKHKIREILNFDAGTKISSKQLCPNYYKELFLIPNLKFQMKL